MSHASDLKSDVSDIEARPDGRQGGRRNYEFAERLDSRATRLFGRGKQSEISRRTGRSKQTVSAWFAGSMPSGDALFVLADAIEVNPRWLATGVGEELRHAEASESDDSVRLPVIDLFKFDEGHMPDPIDTLLIRRELLASAVRTTAPLWVATMPSDTMPDIAREGDQIICMAPDAPLVDGRVYVFLLDGRPLVRRVSLRPEGLVLKAGDTNTDPILIEPNQLERLAPVGRVLAALTVQAV